MSARTLIASTGMIILFILAPRLRADEVDMQNGDRYFGTVLSVSADTVVVKSDMLGVINVPRKQVANLAFGVKAATPKMTAASAPAALSTNPPPAASVNAQLDLSAALRELGANTNFIGQIRRQLLAGNAAATSNYDAMVSGLLSGSLNLDDLRRQAQAAADQLREMKRDSGAAAGISVDAYLGVLDNFLNETASQPTNAAPAAPPQSQAP